MEKTFSMKQHPGYVMLHLHADLDAMGADELARALDAAVRRGEGTVIVDLSEVHYITSTALAVLVTAYKRLKQAGRVLELTALRPEVYNVFLMTGLNTLIAAREYAGNVHDVMQQDDPDTAKAMSGAREYVLGLLQRLDLPAEEACAAVEEIFRICTTPTPPHAVEADLRALVDRLDLPRRIRESLIDRPNIIHERLVPYLPGGWSVLVAGGGDGRLGQLLASDHDVQLLDTTDRNDSSLPIQRYDGTNVPFPDRSFDATVAVSVLHGRDDPAGALRELIRVTRNRIVLIETIALNETQRRFNMFFEWFYGCIIGGRREAGTNFRKPEDWEHLFRSHRLAVKASVDIGVDQTTLPEYHWLYVLDVPGSARRQPGQH